MQLQRLERVKIGVGVEAYLQPAVGVAVEDVYAEMVGGAVGDVLNRGFAAVEVHFLVIGHDIEQGVEQRLVAALRVQVADHGFRAVALMQQMTPQLALDVRRDGQHRGFRRERDAQRQDVGHHGRNLAQGFQLAGGHRHAHRQLALSGHSVKIGGAGRQQHAGQAEPMQ